MLYAVTSVILVLSSFSPTLVQAVPTPKNPMLAETASSNSQPTLQEVLDVGGDPSFLETTIDGQTRQEVLDVGGDTGFLDDASPDALSIRGGGGDPSAWKGRGGPFGIRLTQSLMFGFSVAKSTVE